MIRLIRQISLCSATVPPLKGFGINGEKSLIAGFVPGRATLAQGSPGINPVVGCNSPHRAREATTPVWQWRGAGHRQLIGRRMGAAAIREYPSLRSEALKRSAMEETP